MNKLFAPIIAVMAACHGGDPASVDASVDLAQGEPCVTDADCPPGTQYTGPDSAYNMRLCVYKIADGCAAQGHCANLELPLCASLKPYCGCNGTMVRGGCGYQAGYVSGAVPADVTSSYCDGGT